MLHSWMCLLAALEATYVVIGHAANKQARTAIDAVGDLVDAPESHALADLLLAFRPSLARAIMPTARQMTPIMAEDSAIKGPKNAYMWFLDDRRSEITATLKAELGDDFTIGTVSQKASAEWKSLSDAEKDPYNAKAAADRKRYDDAVAAAGGPPRKTKAKDNAIKKPKNAYMWYLDDRRPEVTAGLKAQLGADFTLGQVSKVVGAEWKAISAAGREPYDAKAAADKQRYEDELIASGVSLKKTKDNGIKKPKNAYMWYLDERRPEVTAGLKAELGSDFTLGQVSKVVGAEWKAMSAAAKEPYDAKAAADKSRYESELR